MIPLIDRVLEPFVWFMADWSLRWAVFIALLAVWLAVFRPRRAATRSLAGWVVLVAGLLLPLLPRWGSILETPAFEAQQSVVAVDDAGSSTSLDTVPSDSPKVLTGNEEISLREPAESVYDNLPGPPEADPKPETLGTWRLVILGLSLFWLAGVLVLLLRQAGGHLLLRRVRREALSIDENALRLFEACRTELGLRRRAKLGIHPKVSSPLTLGLFRPLILVPPAWTELSEEQRRGSLLHELAHLARYDDWSALLFEQVRTCFFFHPFVLWLLSRLEREREFLCDERVIAHGLDQRTYAQMLLDFSRRPGRLLPGILVSPSHPIRFGARRTVKARIHRLLEENMQRWMKPLSTRRAILFGAIALGLTLPLGTFGTRSNEAEAQDQSVAQDKSKQPGRRGLQRTTGGGQAGRTRAPPATEQHRSAGSGRSVGSHS